MSTQMNTALSLIRNGIAMQLGGLIYGLILQNMPFPRLALTTHIQFVGSGGLMLAAGLLLYQPSLLELGPTKCRIIFWAFASTWVMIAANVANAFWGTKEMLPLTAELAGAPGALFWQEQIVTASHAIPGIALIIAYGLLLQGVLVAKGRKDKE